MRQQAEWTDNPELFEGVCTALKQGLDGVQVRYADERSTYRDDGYIVLRTTEGRTFYLLLAEEVR